MDNSLLYNACKSCRFTGKSHVEGRFSHISGGLPHVSYNTRGMYSTGFDGCIQDVFLKKDYPLQLTKSVTEGQGITQCQGN